MNTTENVKHPIIARLGEILQDSDGLFNIVKLNFLFFVTAMPLFPFITLFTLGGSITALSGCMSLLVKTGNLSDAVKKYIYYFKYYFKDSMLWGAVLYVLTILFGAGFYIYIYLAADNIIFVPLASFSLLGLISLWSVAIHLFHAVIGFNLPNKNRLISYAVSRAVVTVKKTVTAVILGMVIFAGMVLFFPATVPLILSCAFSVPGIAGAFANTTPEFII